MSKLTLKMKLGVGFGALLILMLVMGFAAYNMVGRLSEQGDRVVSNMTKKELTVQIDNALELQTSGVRGYLLTGNEDMLQRNEEGKQQFDEKMTGLEKMLVTEQGKKLSGHIRQSTDEFRSIMAHDIQLRRAGKVKEASALAFSLHTGELRTDLEKTIDDLLALEDKLKTDALKEQDATESSTRLLVLSLALVGLLVGVVVAFLIARSITSAIAHMLALIQEIAANNLAADDMQITSQDEIGHAGTALNGMKNNLRNMIQSIAGTAEHVASASEEISSSATQQAQGAETQKDQTAQVATAMQEMSSTVLQVSDNSNNSTSAQLCCYVRSMPLVVQKYS